MRNEARDEWITVAFEESDMKKMGYICWKSSNFFLRLEEASKLAFYHYYSNSSLSKMLITLSQRPLIKEYSPGLSYHSTDHLSLTKREKTLESNLTSWSDLESPIMG